MYKDLAVSYLNKSANMAKHQSSHSRTLLTNTFNKRREWLAMLWTSLYLL
jgi:hypothetical protein